MNILMLLNAYYPDDIRVRKESMSLVQGGHQVFLLCRKRPFEAKEEKLNGVSLHRINAGHSNYMLAFWDIVMSQTFVHPLFFNKAKKLVKSLSIDVIHVHDLPLAGSALKVKKHHPNLKVVIDLHENYPEGLKVWHNWKKNPIARLKNRLFMNYGRWEKHEKSATMECDRIIAVVEEMKDKLIQNHQIDPNKIAVVTNTEDQTFLDQPINPDIYDLPKDSFIIAYCGGIGPHRGVDLLIDSMKYLSKYQNIKLVISGYGSRAVMDHLKTRIQAHGLDNVILRGKIPFSEFLSVMKYADVNVIPHRKNGHTNNTIPHKLFQGMMSGTPLLVSSCSPLKRVVESVKSGLVFEADNAQDLASQIEAMYQSPELRMELATNGINATVSGDLNWESTARDLLQLYTFR